MFRGWVECYHVYTRLPLILGIHEAHPVLSHPLRRHCTCVPLVVNGVVEEVVAAVGDGLVGRVGRVGRVDRVAQVDRVGHVVNGRVALGGLVLKACLHAGFVYAKRPSEKENALPAGGSLSGYFQPGSLSGYFQPGRLPRFH